MMILLLTATSLGLMTAAVAAHHGRSVWRWLIYGVLLGVVALPHALLLRRLPEAGDPGFAGFGFPVGNRQCFHCDRTISADAVICQYCQRPLYGSRARDDVEDEPASPEAAPGDVASARATAPWAADSFARIVEGERRSAHSADARSSGDERKETRGFKADPAKASTAEASSAAPNDQTPADEDDATATVSTPAVAREASPAGPAARSPQPPAASVSARAETIVVGPSPVPPAPAPAREPEKLHMKPSVAERKMADAPSVAVPALADASTFPSLGDEPRFVAPVVTDPVVGKATRKAPPSPPRDRVAVPDPRPSWRSDASMESIPPPPSRAVDVEARSRPVDVRRSSLTLRATRSLARSVRPLLVDATQIDHSASDTPTPHRAAATSAAAATIPHLHALRAQRDDRMAPSENAPISTIPTPLTQRPERTANAESGTPGISSPRAAASLPAGMPRRVLSPYGGRLVWTGGVAALCIVAAGVVWYGQPRPAADGISISVEDTPPAPAPAESTTVAVDETAVAVPPPPEIAPPDWQRQASAAAESPRSANPTSDRLTAAATTSAGATSAPTTSANATPADNVDSRIVSSIQRELNALGYQAGPVDGVFGPRTRDAIRRFEDRIGMSVDGVIDAPLLDALGIRVASRAATN